jgi:hypothetical protein
VHEARGDDLASDRGAVRAEPKVADGDGRRGQRAAVQLERGGEPVVDGLRPLDAVDGGGDCARGHVEVRPGGVAALRDRGLGQTREGVGSGGYAWLPPAAGRARPRTGVGSCFIFGGLSLVCVVWGRSPTAEARPEGQRIL